MDNITGKLGFQGKVVELVSQASTLVPTSPNVDVQTLIADDYDPMFAIVEVIRSGTSENNRRYNSGVVQQIYGMVPGVHGYLGHKDPNKSHFEFRDPQSLYVGAKIEEIGNGVVRILGKAYIFKNSKLREWIPKSIAAGKPLTVSIYGDGDVMRGQDGILEVLNMTSLESIDWANPGTQGMSTSQAVAVVSEIKDGQDDPNNKGGANHMERQEVISGATIAEVKAFNPTVIDSVIAGVTVAELKEQNKAVYDEIVVSATVSEMKLNVDGTEQSVKLTDVQGILDAKDSTIAEMKESQAKAKLETFKKEKIAELVDEKYREKIAGRVVGDTEEAIETSIKSEAAYIAEMIGVENVNPVQGAGAQTNDFDSTLVGVQNLFGTAPKAE